MLHPDAAVLPTESYRNRAPNCIKEKRHLLAYTPSGGWGWREERRDPVLGREEPGVLLVPHSCPGRALTPCGHRTGPEFDAPGSRWAECVSFWGFRVWARSWLVPRAFHQCHPTVTMRREDEVLTQHSDFSNCRLWGCVDSFWVLTGFWLLVFDFSSKL